MRAGLVLFLLTAFGTSVPLTAVAQTREVKGDKATLVSNADETIEKEIKATSEKMVTAFNSGKPEEIVGLFLPSGELIDEAGTVHRGTTEIRELLIQFFQKFPGAKVSVETDSVRSVGPVVIQEGTKVTTKDGVSSNVQFTAVLTKTEKGWQLASLRHFPEVLQPTANEQLQVLEWLIGDWVNEGADARVKIAYRWSEDGNFLLGEFHVFDGSNLVSKSSQRIAWDPVYSKPRSWLFDSDGGFSEATWTALEDGRWVLRSSAVLPNATTGSATLTLTPADATRFTFSGTSRLIGNVLEDDFELIVVKKAPTAGGK